MAKVKQPYDEPRFVAWLDGVEVAPGEVVAVSDGDLAGFLEAGWIPADAATVKAGKRLLKAGTITVLAGVDEEDEPAAEEPADDKPEELQ